MTDEKDMDQSGETPDVNPDIEQPDDAAAAAENGEAAEVSEASAGDDPVVAVGEAQQPDAEGEAEQPVVDVGDGAEASSSAERDVEEAMLAMLEELPEEDAHTSPDDIDLGQTSVSNAEFQHLSEPASTSEPRNIDLLMDVNLPISIELGRTKMPISDILALGPGSVVELNKLAGEPVDLLVNYKIVAKGEVVVVDENFGVRVVQLITPEERLKILGEE